MRPLSLDEVRQAVQGAYVAPARANGAAPVSGVCTDSRNVRKGELFVAISGPNFDGHDFLSAAFALGCGGAIVRQDAPLDPGLVGAHGGRLIAVGDTVQALGALAAWYRQGLGATVLAVTGSNGKTTVKRMIDHILSKTMRGTCSPKSFNNNIGVPLTLLGASPTDDYVVCEVGSNAPGEIATLARIARPDIAVITSVAQTHLEKLGTIELVAVEKVSILEYLSKRGKAVVWADCQPLAEALKEYSAEMIRFGAAEEADFGVRDVVGLAEAVRFVLHFRDAGGKARSVSVSVPLPGRHNAMNAAGAIAAASLLGVDVCAAAEALADFGGVEMRLQPIQVGTLRVINDAYNANPSSAVAAADVLKDQTAARKVMILGEMRELGRQSEQLHLLTGQEIADRKIDLLIGVGALGRYIVQGAARNGLPGESFESVEQAQSAMGRLLRPGDVVLIKGSRAMAMERLIATIRQVFDGQGPAGPGERSLA